MLIIDLYNFNSGFCDRLKKITFYVTFARLNNLKKIFILEKKTKECPFLFSELCNFTNIEIIRIKKKPKNFVEKFKLNEFNSNINKKSCKIFLKNFSSNEINSFFKEWKKSYIFLQPKKKIKKKINKYLFQKKKIIGLHFRLTDKLVSLKQKLFELPWKDTVTIQEFLNFKNIILLKLLKNNNNFFIASDDLKTKNLIIEIINKKKKKYFFNNSKYSIKNFRQTSGEDFIIDLFLLSKCDKIYSSGGGVPDTALLMSKKKIKLIKWNKSKVFYFNINTLSSLIFNIRKFFFNKKY